VSYAIYGSTADNATSDSSGDFSKSLGGLGIYTLTYRKSGYIDATQTATLSTDNQTLVVATLTQLSSSCSAGTVAGNITDSVSSSIVSGVSLSVRSGVNVTSGSTTGVTELQTAPGIILLVVWLLVGILFRLISPDTQTAILTSSLAAE